MTSRLPPPLALLPGSLLVDEPWLTDRLDQFARQSGCSDRRTNATLWWYSASVVLLTPAVHALLLEDVAVSLSPSSIRFVLRFNGYLDRVVSGPELPAGPDPKGSDPRSEALGRHLDDALGAIIDPLARISGASRPSLWAIAADSLATLVLGDVSNRVRPEELSQAATTTAAAIAAGSRLIRPVPRFVDIAVDDNGGRPPRTYVRRGSCCLIYRVPEGKCIACPAQPPAERAMRLRRHAETMGSR